MSASRNVQLLETEPSPLLVLGCGTVCRARVCVCDTLSRRFRAENLKHSLGTFIPRFCFSFFLVVVLEDFN